MTARWGPAANVHYPPELVYDAVGLVGRQVTLTRWLPVGDRSAEEVITDGELVAVAHVRFAAEALCPPSRAVLVLRSADGSVDAYPLEEVAYVEAAP